MFDASSGSSRSEQTSTKGGAGLRSPAYALFETLDAEAAAIEATGRAAGATLAPGYEATIQTFEEGQIVRGTVTGIRENEVIVDVGFKSEGTILDAGAQEPSSMEKTGAEEIPASNASVAGQMTARGIDANPAEQPWRRGIHVYRSGALHRRRMA